LQRIEACACRSSADVDDNGYLTPGELRNALGGIGLELSAREARAFVATVDGDHDGKVSRPSLYRPDYHPTPAPSDLGRR
jgi:hypothetical protein